MSEPGSTTKGTPEVDTVVFDFGGVVIDWNPRHLFASVIPDPDQLDHFLTVVCPIGWHLQHDRGVPFAETIPARQAAFPEHADRIALWQTRYPEMIAAEVPGTAAIIDELAGRGVRLLGLSNMPAEVWPAVRADWPVTTRFEGVLVSGQEGMMKPDPAIFALLISRYDLVPTTTLFIDDVPANVDAAKASGLRAVRFVDADRLRRDLADLGVDVDLAPAGTTRTA